MTIRIRERNAENATILDLSGRVTEGEGAHALRDEIRDQAARGNTHLLLNFNDVSYIDSSGIGELVSGFQYVVNRGGRLKLENLTDRCRDLLQITKLYSVFEVFDNEESAVRSFPSPRSSATAPLPQLEW